MLVAAIAVLAAAIRFPYLWDIPQFTDESLDSLVVHGIYQGKRTLVGSDPYTGAFNYYVEAGLYVLFGSSVLWPRLFVCVLAVGAVVATYLLGTELGLRLAGGQRAWAVCAGAVAALLLATNAIHVATNSHLAWPHSTTPFYLALTAWALERGIRLRSGGWIAAGGLLAGLTQQQHPTMALLWPGLAIMTLIRARWIIRTRWLAIAIVAFVVGAAPLIIYNAASGFGSLGAGRDRLGDYLGKQRQEARDKDYSYLGRQMEMAMTALRIPSSAIDARQPWAYLADPIVLVYASAVAGGVILAARRGAWSPLVCIASFAALLPFFPASHDLLPRQARYLMPLAPLAFAGAGLLVAEACRRLPTTGSIVAVVVLTLVIGIVYPLVPLWRYYAGVLALGETNSRYFATLETIQRLRAPNEWVVLDPSLQWDRPGAGGTALRTFDFMLTLAEIPHATLEQSADRIERRVQGDSALVIADERPGSVTTSANAAVWNATELPNVNPGGFAIWRITRK